MQKLAKSYTSQLDVRKIISNSVSLRDFYRCFLSPQQKALMAKQLTRTQMADDETPEESQDGNPFYKYNNDQKFLKVLEAFKPNSTFERNLV